MPINEHTLIWHYCSHTQPPYYYYYVYESVCVKYAKCESELALLSEVGIIGAPCRPTMQAKLALLHNPLVHQHKYTV